jgi:hypothetical protein
MEQTSGHKLPIIHIYLFFEIPHVSLRSALRALCIVVFHFLRLSFAPPQAEVNSGFQPDVS